MDQVTGRLFQAKDYAKALKHKEDTGAIMIRRIHPVLGVVYEVIYVPQTQENAHES